MFRQAKKVTTNAVEWLLYKKLKSGQKEKLAKMFTTDQKAYFKRLFKTGKKQAKMKQVDRLRNRLTTQGFQEKALVDLAGLYTQKEDLFLQKLAGYELLVWYGNLQDQTGAKKVIDIGTRLLESETDPDRLRKLIIMLTESYDLLGETKTAQKILSRLLESDSHQDTFLAAANLERTPAKKIEWINHIYRKEGAKEIALKQEVAQAHTYDLLTTTEDHIIVDSSDQKSKVSIIVPAYNAEDKITIALNSLTNQTWKNIEILIVDDCSTDRTIEVVKDLILKDSRIHLFQTEENSGAYVARNTALKQATGKYVTINDADDWSHPEKIERQVRHLDKHPQLIGNFSSQARLSNKLSFYRRGKLGVYIFANFSSFMFSRERVFNELGYWDSVRFAGDSEYMKRIKKVFGEKAIVEIASAPMSFQRQTEDSLTGDSAFGFPGFFMGARKEYAEAHEFYHASGNSLKYPFPQEIRPFPILEPMKPERTANKGQRRHFDVIIASEFRLLGGTNMSNIEEIKAQKQHGFTTGLIQLNRYDLNSVEKINPAVRNLIDGDKVQMLVYGEKVSCDVLIVRHPPALQEWQKYVPDVQAKSVHVIVNQPPKRDYSETGETLYRIEDCLKNLKTYVGQEGTWFPIGPEIRRALLEHHQDELNKITFANEDWVNIINVEEWKRDNYASVDGKIRIGRHSRDQYVKWPETKEKMEKVYPSISPFEIHVLGGAKSVKKVLGELPKNWMIKEFGEETPQEFLKTIDVFVYYTHSNWVEAFGRVIFEAMAAGVPVIIPPQYEALFKEAAIYAEPEQVKATVEAIVNNKEKYEEQVKKAQAFVEDNFGYTKHIGRIVGDIRG